MCWRSLRCHTWCVSWRRIWSSSNSSGNHWLLFGTNNLHYALKIKMTTYQFHEISYSCKWKSLYVIQFKSFYSVSVQTTPIQVIQVKFSIRFYQNINVTVNALHQIASYGNFWAELQNSDSGKYSTWVYGSSFTSTISSQVSHQPNQPIHSILNYLFYVSIQLCFLLHLLYHCPLCWQFSGRC